MNEKKWDVYVYGDVNIDIVIPGVEKFPEPGQEMEVPVMETFAGGGAALFALGIGKLGLHPVFQGEVGDDCYGDFIRKEFLKCHVDDFLLQTSKTQKTGISLSFTDKKDRSFLTYRGTNESLHIDAVDIERVKGASHIHVTGYAGSSNHDAYLSFLKRIKEETQISVSFDLGWDSTGEWKHEIYRLFPYIDVLFMNETEAQHYARKEDVREAALDFAAYCGLAVIKMGKKGSIAVKGREIYKADAYLVDAIDTTGAGDSFNAGFVYGFLKGKSPEDSLRTGNACGALSVTALGGNTGFPTEDRLMKFIQKSEAVVIKIRRIPE